MQLAIAEMAGVSADRVSVSLTSGRRLGEAMLEAIGLSARRLLAGGVIVDYIIAMPGVVADNATTIATSMEQLSLTEVSSIVDAKLSAAGFDSMAPSATGFTSQAIMATTQAPPTADFESDVSIRTCGVSFLITAFITSIASEVWHGF